MSTPLIQLMLIEDNELDVEFVERLLRKLKVKVTLIHAENGLHALEILKQLKPPYAILVDINMPLMTGLDFLKIIGRDPVYKSVPCYVLSSSSLPQDMRNANEHGAEDYMIKPITAEQLLGILPIKD